MRKFARLNGAPTIAKRHALPHLKHLNAALVVTRLHLVEQLASLFAQLIKV